LPEHPRQKGLPGAKKESRRHLRQIGHMVEVLYDNDAKELIRAWLNVIVFEAFNRGVQADLES